MKLEKISAIAEIVSSVAIVLTLVYLTVQTQQNTSALQASVRQGMLAEETQLILSQLDYPYLNAMNLDNQELDPNQRLQARTWITAFLRVRENHWLQYQAGVIDATTWQAYRLPIRIVLTTNIGREEWGLRRNRGEFAQGFVDDVDQFLASE